MGIDTEVKAMAELAQRYGYTVKHSYSDFIGGYNGAVKPPRKVTCWWTSTVAFVYQTEKENVVVYRGTDNFADWIFNALVKPVDYRGIKCHWGFSLAHRSIWRKVVKNLDINLPIVFLGHSLGGALAEISTHIVAQYARGKQQVSCITFGKPNVLSNDTIITTKPKTIGFFVSVVNPCDPVTMIPMVNFRPTPFQNKLVLTDTGKVVLNPTPGYIKSKMSLEGVDNHKMSEYMERLKNASSYQSGG